MPGTIKNISIIYDAINQENTFSCGDFISGRLILEVGKETKIDYLLIKAKGKAKALWSERVGEVTVVYYEKEKFFTLEYYPIPKQNAKEQDSQSLISGNEETYSNIVAPGTHEYPFTFKIPEGDMPSSFKGSSGKIIYSLQAKLSRSMRAPRKAKEKFNFISKIDPAIPQMLEPQFGIKEEKLKFFASGNVSLNIKIERMGYLLGEGLKVTAEIGNNSSRKVAPKFYLYQKQSFFAMGKRRVYTKNILKETGEPVPTSTGQTVTKVLSIPDNICPTVLNCKVVHVEYRLKVCLDIAFAKDPEIRLPLVLLRADSEFAKMVPTHTSGGYTSANTPEELPPPYSALFAPGGFPPQSAPGSFPPQAAPSAPPPQFDPGDFLSLSGPSAPPSLTGPTDFLSQSAPASQPAAGMYPST